MECAEQQQYVLRLLAQDTGSAVNGQQVGCIEASDKLHVHFAVIDVHQHAVKSILKNFALEVAKRSERIGVYFCLCILNHDHTVSVIGICQGESRFRQSVEECLFCLQVVFECFVIVQMVAGDVREDASGEPQPSDTFLGYRKCELTSMKAYLQPSSAMRPSSLFSVIGSGVVWSVGMASPSI